MLDGGGEYFPQPWAGDVRMDDLLGEGPWLITREAVTGGALAAFAADLKRWLDSRQADAVFIRPDRYVFGVGAPEALEDAWAQQVS